MTSKHLSVVQLRNVVGALSGRDMKVREVCRKLGIAERTIYRWRKRYGGLDRSEVRRLKTLEHENARLKKLLADAMLDNAILKEAASGDF